jgi:hypothetical protein
MGARTISQKIIARQVFGDEQIIAHVIGALSAVRDDRKFTSAIRQEAQSYISALCKFETVLTAFIFKGIFSHSTPLSNYLQTKGLDLMQAKVLVDTTAESLKKTSRTFDQTVDNAREFAVNSNETLSKLDNIPEDIVVQDELPEQRKRGERGDVLKELRSIDKFRVNVYNRIIDTLLQSFDKRFEATTSLYSEMSWLSPSRFPDLQSGLVPPSFSFLGRLVEAYFHVENAGRIIGEQLQHLAARWSAFCDADAAVLCPEAEARRQDQDSSDDEVHHNVTGRACAIDVYRLLIKYSLYSRAYDTLSQVYKIALTFSATQVMCERCFSKLKKIKTCYRANISQSRLDAFLLMAVERPILNRIENSSIVDLLSESSTELQRLLKI